MRKRLLTLSMVSLLTVCLASCSSISSKKTDDGKDIIVSIKNNDTTLNYTADDLLDQYLKTESGVKAYYDAIYDLLIRNGQDITGNMKQSVEEEMENFVNTCKTNAATNGTKYKTELSNSLEAAGVDNLGEYRELKELEIQKNEYQEEFYEDKKLVEFTPKYIEEKVPYHIRHILVKTDDVEGTSVYNKEISKDEAKKIYSVLSRLASGKESFGDIAYDASDDTSNSLYGSVGIMAKDEGFVSEFKYSIYYYDIMLSGKNDTGLTKEDLLNRLDIPSEVKISDKKTLNTESVLNKSVGAIPFNTVKMFEDYADTTKTVKNLKYTDEIVPGVDRHEINSSYYPRNVLFNTYFNNHGLSFITSAGYEVSADNKNWSEPSAELKAVLGDSFSDKILTDNGNPILVTYNPSTGLHFMIIEKSPFNQKYKNYTDYTDDANGKVVELKSLNEELLHYYSLDVPSGNDNVTNDNRFVTYIKTTRTEYNNRAELLKGKIKAYDPHMDYQLFESLLYENENNKNVKIEENILNSIIDYMNDQRAKTAYTEKQNTIASWTTYLQLLDFQAIQKEAKQLDFSETKVYFTDTKDL